MLGRSGGPLEPNLLNKWGRVLFQFKYMYIHIFFCHKLLDEKERYHDGGINHWTKVQAFLYPWFCLTSSVVDCLTLWGEFETKRTPDVKESGEHFLLL